jgi:hypothetical protein
MWHLDEGTIHAWLDGALSADESRRVEAHVGSCTGCADAVAEARGLIAASSRILTALDDVPNIRGATGATGTRGRRSLTTWLVRERIAAVVAMVVATGALALVVARDDVPAPASVEALSEPVATVELAAADSPAAPPTPSQAKKGEDARAVQVTTPVAAPPPARDLAMNRVDSAPAAALRLEDVTLAEASLSRAQARTDDTLRPIALAQAPRAEAQAYSAEGKAAVAEKLPTVSPGRQRGAEASARFAPPTSEQAISLRGAAVGAARDTRLILEERMTESGRDVRRRIYRVDSTLVTLDERAPDTRELEQRRARVETNAPEAAPILRADSAATRTNTIQWTDARGVEFTLSGAASPARLEEIRKLLGY